MYAISSQSGQGRYLQAETKYGLRILRRTMAHSMHLRFSWLKNTRHFHSIISAKNKNYLSVGPDDKMLRGSNLAARAERRKKTTVALRQSTCTTAATSHAIHKQQTTDRHWWHHRHIDRYLYTSKLSALCGKQQRHCTSLCPANLYVKRHQPTETAMAKWLATRSIIRLWPI